MPTNEQFSAYTIPGCQTDFLYRERAGSYVFLLMRWEHSGGGVSSKQRAAVGAGPWVLRCLLPLADMGMKPTSALLPGFWSRPQTMPGAWQCTVNAAREALCLLLVTTPTSWQHQRSHFAKAAHLSCVRHPHCSSASLPRAQQAGGALKPRRQQPSGLVGLLHWLQGSAACWGAPHQNPSSSSSPGGQY